jgi:hypothetical protein
MDRADEVHPRKDVGSVDARVASCSLPGTALDASCHGVSSAYDQGSGRFGRAGAHTKIAISEATLATRAKPTSPASATATA